MPTVLLAWELGGGAGHCVNLAPIAEGLAARGCSVWVAARDLTTARRIIGPSDVQYLQAPFLSGAAQSQIRPTRSFAHILHNIGFGDDAQLDVLVSAWHHLFDLVRPDVVICEHAPTALLASRRYACRRVVLGTGFFSPPAVAPMPELRYWLPPDSELAHVEAEILERVNQLLDRRHSQPLERLSQLYSDADEDFLLTFRELDHYPQREAAGYWGMWSPSQHDVPPWPEAAGPRIFAYLKRLPSSSHMALLLASIRGVRLPSLVFVTDGNPAWLRRFHSPLLRFLTKPVDIHTVASQCDLAIHNGNAGTATALLLAGVPQLSIPLFLEQEVFSRRIADLGAAVEATANRPEQFGIRLMTLIHQRERHREAAQKFAARYADFDATDSVRQILARIGDLLE